MVLAVDEHLCKDDFHKNLFLEIKNNLLNLSGVHEIMIDEKDFTRINFEKKILRIFGYMQNLYPKMNQVEIDVKVNNVNLHISQGMTLGLVINQLIQISYEQSFKNNPQGKINIALHISGNNCVLNYKDNGSDLTEDQINGNLLELRLAEIFSDTLKGKFDITTGSGNKFILSFPVEKVQEISEISVN
jgi:two-component sensor histidine kinase